jgi:phosphoglycolate phosphatase-like HAD superfamily hydrolase
MHVNYKKILSDIHPTKEYFVGIDSDGCAFDTMEIKHKECFCPNTILHWDLQIISKYVRESWEFVNLYSQTRGSNRFHSLINVIELLSKRKEVLERNVKLPDMSALIEWTKRETKLSNPELSKYEEKINDPIISKALKWSQEINKDITKMVYGIPPFPYVKNSLAKLSEKADTMVISQTPIEALTREWEENDIEKYVSLIAGQEYGTKTEHLRYGAKGKYDDDKILMIGDAFGDLKAAKANGVLFYPIKPGYETESWKTFYNEGLDRFFAGTYKGMYEENVINEFEEQLSSIPNWKLKN